jgi:PAS domain S-box-containing protein
MKRTTIRRRILWDSAAILTLTLVMVTVGLSELNRSRASISNIVLLNQIGSELVRFEVHFDSFEQNLEEHFAIGGDMHTVPIFEDFRNLVHAVEAVRSRDSGLGFADEMTPRIGKLNDLSRFLLSDGFDQTTRREQNELIIEIYNEIKSVNHLYASFSQKNHNNLQVLVGIQEKRLKLAVLVFLGLGLFSIILYIYIGVGLSRRISRPIVQLDRAATEMSTGNFDIEAKIETADEIGELAAAFNHMVVHVRKNTNALKESEEKYRLLLNSQTDLVVKIDTAGVFLFVNPSYCEMFGKSEDELLGKKFAPLVHEDDRDHTAIELQKLYQPPFHVTIRQRVMTVHGWRWFEWLNTAIVSDEDVVAEIVGVGRDISESQQALEERERLEDQLRQSQKMEAVGQLAGGVAHDFNNLLQAILGYGELVADGTDPDGPVRGFVEQILKAGNRAKALVGHLLAYSRRQVLDMKEIDLNEVINDLMKMLQRIIGEHVDQRIVLGHELGIVRADRGQVEQILTNLCINARDAMPDGGTITIETKNELIDTDFCETHPWAIPGRYVLLNLTDTGCGMDEQTLSRIFEPFYTTKREGEGTGLGLSTVYGLVTQHEGMIQVQSKIGQGTTFQIYLPVVAHDVTITRDQHVVPVIGGTETILLAEDEELVRNSTRTVLEQAGYTVLCAGDGVEALSVFEERPDRIDLALLDVKMPRLGGRAVAERIFEVHPTVRILFSSGYSRNVIDTDFVLDETLELIQKPYRRDDLLRRVREVLERS